MDSQPLTPRKTLRRTHSDPTVTRVFDDVDSYWSETTERRRYSIPHSDGSFFSDGSGYSNGPLADLQYEAAERLREVMSRLKSIDQSILRKKDEARANSDFLPSAAEIEEAIRVSERGLDVLLGDQAPSKDALEDLKSEIFRLSGEFISRGAGLCGTFLDSAAVEAGRALGTSVGKCGGIALVLYLTGVDFHGVAKVIGELISKIH